VFPFAGKHDRERQRLAHDRPDGRTSHGEGALLGGLSIKSLQVRAELGLLGKPRDIKGQTKASGSPSSEALPEVTSFAQVSAKRAAVEAIMQGESRPWR